jgi:HlyD family secretion protein
MARLTPLHYLPALIAAATVPALSAPTAASSEIAVETRTFSIEQAFPATLLPAEPELVRLDAKAWSDFEIDHIAPHGSRVKKGDKLITFVTEEFEKRLHDTREAAKTRALTLAQAELEFTNLKEATPLKLESLSRAARIAKEENTYFTTVRRKAEEESAAQRLLRSHQLLANQREELSQLTKMYEADDLTEETEEIILIRQRDAVASAEFALRMETLNNERILKVMLPREAETLAEAEKTTAMALAKAQEELPRALEIKAAELAAAKTAAEREDAALADLETDRKLLEITAKADGWFYHGSIENGRWTVGELAKVLIMGGKAPAKRPIATFIPATSKLGLVAFLDEAKARSLASGLVGTAILAGREDIGIPVKITSVSQTPGADNLYRADLEATFPPDLSIVPGSTVNVRTIAYHKADALTLPAKALRLGPDGWNVEIKLADGKTELRAVRPGRQSGETAEILDGLEPGQVVLLP